MAKTRLTTYRDAIEHLLDYNGADVETHSERFARRAVQQAMTEMAGKRSWTYYYQHGRINTVAQQTDGTLEYDHTGGTYERMVTLTGATWPTWATFGCLRIGLNVYEIAEIKSSTVATLTSALNPGADIAALTTYTLYRDTYPMPIDFLSADQVHDLSRSTTLTKMHPSEWLDSQRCWSNLSAPNFWTYMADPNYFGAIAMKLSPPPDQAYPLDYIYRRLPRQLNVSEYSVGRATCSTATTTVTGIGTAWSSKHVGSVIRFSDVASEKPTGIAGAWPFTVERIVVSVTNATTIVIDTFPNESLANVAYSISDPVDIEHGAMYSYFLRECERQLRIIRRIAANGDEERQHQQAFILACEADNRSFERVWEGGSAAAPFVRLANMPSSSDQG